MSNLSAILEASKGRFVTVSFLKLDGTKRTINGRIGVKKHLKHGKATIDRSKYVVMYSLKDRGYRCINRDTIISVNMNKLHLEA